MMRLCHPFVIQRNCSPQSRQHEGPTSLRCATVSLRMPPPASDASNGPVRVALLHGLARRGRSMSKLARRLGDLGFETHVLQYPSRRASLACLARDHIGPTLSSLCARGDGKLNFVTVRNHPHISLQVKILASAGAHV
jgi:hypothetical protein